MKLEHEILINKYGQGLLDAESLWCLFDQLEDTSQKDFLIEMRFLIQQSKPTMDDVEPAIVQNGLKPTYTPCVLVRQGVQDRNLEKISNLPDNEQKKVFLLLLSLFKIAYQRRFSAEKNIPINGGIGTYPE